MAAKRKGKGKGGSPAFDEKVARRLDALYAELPKLDCNGRCWPCCGPILIAPGERERIREVGGVEVPTVPEMQREHRRYCPALKDHRCSVYEARPMMCRLWGIVESMRCPYGCVPEGGWMTEEEARGFWLRAYAIAGYPVEKEENLTQKQVIERLRVHQAQMRRLPGGRPARVQPDEKTLRRNRRRWPWSR